MAQTEETIWEFTLEWNIFEWKTADDLMRTIFILQVPRWQPGPKHGKQNVDCNDLVGSNVCSVPCRSRLPVVPMLVHVYRYYSSTLSTVYTCTGIVSWMPWNVVADHDGRMWEMHDVVCWEYPLPSKKKVNLLEKEPTYFIDAWHLCRILLFERNK